MLGRSPAGGSSRRSHPQPEEATAKPAKAERERVRRTITRPLADRCELPGADRRSLTDRHWSETHPHVPTHPHTRPSRQCTVSPQPTCRAPKPPNARNLRHQRFSSVKPAWVSHARQTPCLHPTLLPSVVQDIRYSQHRTISYSPTPLTPLFTELTPASAPMTPAHRAALMTRPLSRAASARAGPSRVPGATLTIISPPINQRIAAPSLCVPLRRPPPHPYG